MPDDITQKNHQYFTSFPKRSFPKGQILVFADENPDHTFYIVKGSVRQYDVSYRGDEVIVNIFKAPAFFPMSWALNRTPNKYFYKTESDTELHMVPTDDALQYLKDNPEVVLDLLSRVYRGMDGLLGRMVHLMSGSAKSRLIYEMVIESRRTGAPAKGKHSLGVHEIDLAARAGMSRETVSREMHSLKAAGLVTIDSGGIVVLDLAALEKLSGLSA